MSKTDTKDVTDVVAHEDVKGNTQLLAPEQKAQPIAMATPADLLQMAVQGGADLDRLERLMALQTQWEANEARKAYIVAMAEFKKDPPTIIKDKQVSFKTDKGTTSYKHATIGNVVERIVAGLAAHGFSHRWVPSRVNDQVVITCVITHKLGHSEETQLQAPLDQSGGKNNIQAMISTKTYLERHSLLAATGLATIDQQDDDGRGGDEPEQKKTKALPIMNEKGYKRAAEAIRSGGYTLAQIKEMNALTPDQDDALAQIEKESKK